MLRAFIFLANAAVGADDGTFGVLRGGIDRFNGDGRIAHVRGALVGRVVGDREDAGDHEVQVVLRPPHRAAEVLNSRKFQIDPEGAGLQLVANIDLRLDVSGRYFIDLAVDGKAVASVAVVVDVTNPAERSAG